MTPTRGRKEGKLRLKLSGRGAPGEDVPGSRPRKSPEQPRERVQGRASRRPRAMPGSAQSWKVGACDHERWSQESSATCDGALPMFRDQPLVVVGGGDSACEEATYLTRFASKVYLVHRRDELRASKIMAERTLANDKIEPVWHSEVIEVMDVEQEKVTGVKVRNNQTNEESTIDCAGLFIAIGHIPNTQLFKGVIDMDDAGYILPKRGQETNVTGVYVAGDCSDHVYRQAITAAGQGCAAAIDAERHLASLDQ